MQLDTHKVYDASRKVLSKHFEIISEFSIYVKSSTWNKLTR